MIPVITPAVPRTEADRIELERSIARHPAGKARRLTPSQCPECGQNASGSLGSPVSSLR